MNILMNKILWWGGGAGVGLGLGGVGVWGWGGCVGVVWGVGGVCAHVFILGSNERDVCQGVTGSILGNPLEQFLKHVFCVYSAN